MKVRANANQRQMKRFPIIATVFLILTAVTAFGQVETSSLNKRKVDSKLDGLAGKVTQVKQENYQYEQRSGKIIQGTKYEDKSWNKSNYLSLYII